MDAERIEPGRYRMVDVQSLPQRARRFGDFRPAHGVRADAVEPQRFDRGHRGKRQQECAAILHELGQRPTVGYCRRVDRVDTVPPEHVVLGRVERVRPTAGHRLEPGFTPVVRCRLLGVSVVDETADAERGSHWTHSNTQI
nr:hypothetical protein [Halomicroarcula sp. SHR3]